MKRKVLIISILITAIFIMFSISKVFAISNEQEEYTLKYNILDENKRTVEVVGIETHNHYYENINVEIPKNTEIDGKEYTITKIGENAFGACSGLKNVGIPNKVKEIANGAFRGCSSLEKIEIPNGITSIEESTFSGCNNLTNLTIPDSIISIGDYAFYGCSSLKNINIPQTTTKIGNYAFKMCSGLEQI